MQNVTGPDEAPHIYLVYEVYGAILETIEITSKN